MATNATATGRSAAILTNSEVKATALDMSTTFDGSMTAKLSFTIGSLTNMIVVAYGSTDNATWFPLFNGATQITETLTASTTRMYVIEAPGVPYVTLGVTGTDTVTSSSCTITWLYQRAYLTSSQTDGVQRLST